MTLRHDDFLFGNGKLNEDLEAVGRAVAGADGAAAGLDAGFDDAQAEAGPAGFTGASAIDTVEGVKDAAEIFFGDARAGVGDADDHVMAAPFGVDANGRSGGVAGGVSQDVADGADEQVTVGGDGCNASEQRP